MDEQKFPEGRAADRLAERFEAERSRLRAVAYRMLGSAAEADDAVQETWLRLSRSDADAIEDLAAWLVTVVSRICLNMLRSRRFRREEPLEHGYEGGAAAPETRDRASDRAPGLRDPEEEALLADSVGVALLVVLDTLAPAERLAFVLHDMFAVPFDEIGPMLERTPAAARQLASRARRRVRGGAAPAAAPGEDLRRRRRVVDAFLAATRGGDFEALVSLLHPDVVLRADRAAIPTPEPVEVRGATPVAQGAMAAAGRAQFTGPALIDGGVGLVMAPLGRMRLLLRFTVADGLITEIDVIADADRLRGVELGVPEG
ncbi:RNA polymerase subunit sigma-70 [Streptomyces sp. WAC 06738]|uniref:sigma-70 family RNA polymerase sigma factor n=1 Tax=Streptomyces sp. WAC 06738 TaxID=2203210 RepID=UPI000F6CB721|nr:sigma-70 family RNA polymerase sigma factor [Streptomyces sp. WAC 06738]AZM46924.1 RNA polymerase subunit sigma-70 [Streptomyces sp. WAC 06738]